MAAAYGAHERGLVALDAADAGARREEREIHALAEEKLAFFGQRLMGYRWNQPAYASRTRTGGGSRSPARWRRSRGCSCSTSPPPGMNPVETHEITELIGKLRDEGGYTILVIEHDMHVVEGISDRVVALDHGVKIAEGSFEPVATDPRVVEAYLGTPARRRRSERERRRPLLALDAVNTYYGPIHILQELSLEVRRGRARLPARRQRLRQVDDAEDHPRDRQAAERHGALRRRGRDDALDELPDRARAWRSCPRTGASSAPMTVLENLEMGAYLHGGGDEGGLRPRLHALPAAATSAARQLAGTLSGGEQQMVAMGRALMSRPKLLLMDEPSMGLAPILVERSFEIIKQVHESGVAVLVVEQNANVSLSIADRGYVLSTGRVVLAGKAAELLAGREPAQGVPRALDAASGRS